MILLILLWAYTSNVITFVHTDYRPVSLALDDGNFKIQREYPAIKGD